MKFLVLKTTDPYLNLAIEEYLFLHADDDVFMLWQNSPTVVIGKNQNAFAEINMDFMKQNQVHIARRITGGGAVYHDLGNVNYTFIAPSAGRSLDFAAFTAPIIEALASLGIKAELTGRNDLLTEGKKFSGNAQYAHDGRVLHHGTLLFDSNLECLSHALKVDEEKIKSKAIKSTRNRVTNLRPLLKQDCDTQQFIELIAKFVIGNYHPTLISPPAGGEIEALYKRNASDEWIFPKRDYLSAYTMQKKKRYPFGIVDILLDMSNDVIRQVKISGDFFGILPVQELEEALQGCNLSQLSDALSPFEVSDYIFGMTREQLITQISSPN